jgi:uncharacterized protein YgbK (DUF1537 family)
MTRDQDSGTSGPFIVVIDDDPTGTQMASDVRVLLRADSGAFAQAAAEGSGAVYALADTRSRSESEAREIVASIAAAARSGLGDRDFELVLRGDSTLRGHVFAEMEAVDRFGHGALFVPAWPEGGRITVDGVHWLREGEQWIPVVRTEFARDPDFGFTSAALVDWVAEVAPGWTAAIVELTDLRSSAGAALAVALQSSGPRTVVIPEVEVSGDLSHVLSGLLATEGTGRRPIVRAASSFAALRAGLAPRDLDALAGHRTDHVLVLCGSYTGLATQQLAALARAGHPPTWLGLGVEVGPAVEAARSQLQESGVAVLATDRRFHRPGAETNTGPSAYGQALCQAAAELRDSYDCVIVKGGVTSSEFARDGLGVRHAWVSGQLAPGVPTWLLESSRGPRLPYVIVPGNVGPDTLLVEVLDKLRPDRRRTRSEVTREQRGG